MGEVTIASELLTMAVTLIGALTPTLPFLAKFRSRLGQVRKLLGQIDTALADGKITTAEARTLLKTAREVVGG